MWFLVWKLGWPVCLHPHPPLHPPDDRPDPLPVIPVSYNCLWFTSFSCPSDPKGRIQKLLGWSPLRTTSYRSDLFQILNFVSSLWVISSATQGCQEGYLYFFPWKIFRFWPRQPWCFLLLFCWWPELILLVDPPIELCWWIWSSLYSLKPSQVLQGAGALRPNISW